VPHAEQVAINGSNDVRTLAEQPSVMDLQAKGDGGEKEKEKQETSHGSYLAPRRLSANSGRHDDLRKKTAIPIAGRIVGLFRDLLFTLLWRKITF
jgi:hypothetical protein